MLDADDLGSRRWRVGLAAHPGRQAALAAFARRHHDDLTGWLLLAPAPTAEALRAATGLRVRAAPGGPDAEAALAAELIAGELDALVVLRDPEGPDGAGLLRLADVHNVAVATNLATAECLVRGLAPARHRPVSR